LGLSLLLNAIFLAGKLNKENALTLPDVFAKRYGKTVEVMVSLTTITSFIMLLAGNLVGMGFIVAYTWGVSQTAGIWLSAALVWGYTVSGGLFSVTYADVVQGVIGWSGCIVAAYWLIVNTDESASPPSIGFTGYIYPTDEICQKYFGVPCANDPTLCCYNVDKWCNTTGENCMADVSERVLM
jgi:Na+/proline symporter